MNTELERRKAEIERRLSANLLPCATRRRAFGGPSRGEQCDVCGHPIARNGLGYEVDLLDDWESVTRTLFMHPDCHVIWLELSRELATAGHQARRGAAGRR